MARRVMSAINKKYGRTYGTVLLLLHKLYAHKKECLEIFEIAELSGLYVYPYRILREEMDFAASYITTLLTRMVTNGHIEKITLGKMSFYRLCYDNPEIIDNGVINPYDILKGVEV